METMGQHAFASVEHCPKWIRAVLEWIQTGSDLLGIAVISVALLVTAVRWMASEVDLLRHRSRHGRWEQLREVRLALGNYILVGLEFMIISDIVHSFLKPDLTSMAQLGIVVLIRTTIGYFLGKELETVREDGPIRGPNYPLGRNEEAGSSTQQSFAP